MNRFLPFLFLLLTLVFCESKEEDQNETNSEITTNSEMPEELANIPDGIVVEHNKDTAYAELNEKDPEKRGKYKWHYETAIKTINEDLKIIEFGAYQKHKGEWTNPTIYGRPFNNEEFADWYNCPNGVLIKDSSYTDFNNWSKGNKLDGETVSSLWYYVGTNENGEKFKGVKEVISIHKFETE